MQTVKCLPKVVKRARDAARAVKRTRYQAIHEVSETILTRLLSLPHFRVYGYALESDPVQEILHLYCELELEVAVCPCCKLVTTAIKERTKRCVRDLDVWGRRTFIHFKIRRFECAECEYRFTEELSAVAWRRHQTLRFEQEVYRRCLESSKKAVAATLLLSYSTVDDIFKRYAQQHQCQLSFGHVRVLGMDEIALKKRHKQYVLVLSDLERKCVLAVLPSREKAELARWWDTLSADQQSAIRVVSIDMWRPYRSFVKQHLPRAQIVADRFHVMKQLNDQLSKARRKMQREAEPETKAALKGSRWLLLHSREQLSDDQEQQLRKMLAAHHELRTAYLLKEEFRLIFEKIHDQDRARRFLYAWICKVRQSHNRFLFDFVKTLHNWFDEILNYFDQRISNGFVEGMNRAIRNIISRAYGFRNFDNFRLQILAQHGPPG